MNFLEISVKSKPILKQFKSEKNLLKIKENKYSQKILLTTLSTKDERNSVNRINSNYRINSNLKKNKKRNSTATLKTKNFVLNGQKYTYKRPQSVKIFNKYFNQSEKKKKFTNPINQNINSKLKKERKIRPTTALNFN